MMDIETFVPTNISNLKRLAKQFKRNNGMTHTAGLDAAARRAGFAHYTQALREWGSDDKED